MVRKAPKKYFLTTFKMLHDVKSLSHVMWECKYHIIITPKYRKKKLYGEIRRRIGELLRELTKQKGGEILQGNLRSDHVHMVLSIPPKFSVAMMIGYIKGKSAIRLHNEYGKKKGIYGKNFWARGYYVSTVGADEKVVRDYVKKQEYIDKETGDGQMDRGWF
jgi:putative transposase